MCVDPAHLHKPYHFTPPLPPSPPSYFWASYFRFKCKGQLIAGAHEWTPTPYIFNGLTQIKAWLDLAPLVHDNEWLLFFEDDATVHPSLGDGLANPTAVGALIRASLITSDAMGHGAAYFGLCSAAALGGCGEAPFMRGSVGGGDVPTLNYKQCTGACGHAYAFRGDMLKSLGAQAMRTIEHVRLERHSADGHDSLCARYVACIHDPFGAHEILRQGCNSFAGGWIDGSTGLGINRDGSSANWVPTPIHLPKLKPSWRLRGAHVCGNL